MQPDRYLMNVTHCHQFSFTLWEMMFWRFKETGSPHHRHIALDSTQKHSVQTSMLVHTKWTGIMRLELKRAPGLNFFSLQFLWSKDNILTPSALDKKTTLFPSSRWSASLTAEQKFNILVLHSRGTYSHSLFSGQTLQWSTAQKPALTAPQGSGECLRKGNIPKVANILRSNGESTPSMNVFSVHCWTECVKGAWAVPPCFCRWLS